MGFSAILSVVALLVLPLVAVSVRPDSFLRLPTDGGADGVGTRWAVLIAGSKGFGNYRHQVYRLLLFGLELLLGKYFPFWFPWSFVLLVTMLTLIIFPIFGGILGVALVCSMKHLDFDGNLSEILQKKEAFLSEHWWSIIGPIFCERWKLRFGSYFSFFVYKEYGEMNLALQIFIFRFLMISSGVVVIIIEWKP